MSVKSPVEIDLNNSSTLNITLFAIPKTFESHIATIQRNAIQSWTKLQPKPEIILFGNDPGVAEIALEFQLRHVPNVSCTPQGTPLLNDIFAQVHDLATYPILSYINSDIILLSDFIPTIQAVLKQYSNFLLLGRRWNVDIDYILNFKQITWEEQLRELISQKGIFSGVGALDYFVFPKPLFSQLPEFAVGRAGWDNWMVGEALKNSYSVINASRLITAVHQNHDYFHLKGQRREAFHGTEAQQNKTLLQGTFAGSSANATCYLTPKLSPNSPRMSIILIADSSVISLQSAINSIKNQTNTNYELIIVQDENIKTHQFYPFKSDRIHYIHSPQPGVIAAQNAGLKQATGEFILFLNQEETLHSEAIQNAINSIDKQAGSVEIIFSGWQVPSTGKTIQPCHTLSPILIGRLGLHGLHIWMLPSLWRLLQTGAILFNRSWLEQCGEFDSHFSSHAATLDRVLHLSSKGASGICLEQLTLSCPQANSLPTISLSQQVFECERLLLNFFERPHLTDWMQTLKPLAYYNSYVWLACLMYHAQNIPEMIELLLRSLSYSPYTSVNTLFDWITQFTRISQEYNYQFEVNQLNQLVAWQLLLQKLLTNQY
ncbi:MAG: glycosyltransferase [Microcoleaceae cyanobacterium]